MIDEERMSLRAEQHTREKNEKLGKSETLTSNTTPLYSMGNKSESSLEGVFTLLFWLAFIFLAFYEDKTELFNYTPSESTINNLLNFGAAFVVMIFALFFYKYKTRHPKTIGGLLLFTCFAILLHLVAKETPWLTENILQCLLTAYSAFEGYKLLGVEALDKHT